MVAKARDDLEHSRDALGDRDLGARGTTRRVDPARMQQDDRDTARKEIDREAAPGNSILARRGNGWMSQVC